MVRAVAEERPTARSRCGIALKATDREDVPESIDRAAQAHLEDHAHRKGGNGVGGEDDDTGGEVEGRAVAQGLGNAQRNTDQVAHQERDDAEPERDRQSPPDELPRRPVRVLVTLHLHPQTVAEGPGDILLPHRLIEAELLLEFLLHPFADERGIGPAAGFAAAAHPAHLRQLQVHRPARQQTRQQKAGNRNPEEGRHKQH